MKVLLLNGSPHAKGCTYTALSIISDELNNEGIDTEIFNAGINILPCRACHACAKLKKCIIDDNVNEFLDKAETSDGFIFGTPVHYASASGIITSFLDRAFYANAWGQRNVFRMKPGAVITSARRAGTTAAMEQLNKYFSISEMPIISSRYWNMVHGNSPDEVKQDLEGIQIMRILAKNMAYHLKCKEIAEKSGLFPPEKENQVSTSFIR